MKTKKLPEERESMRRPKPPAPARPEGACERCGIGFVTAEPENHRTKCPACGAYEYDWVKEAGLLSKVGGKRSPRECVRSPSYAPPELLDFTKTDLVDLVWGLAEKWERLQHQGSETAGDVVATILREYGQQHRLQNGKPNVSKRVLSLLEKLR